MPSADVRLIGFNDLRKKLRKLEINTDDVVEDELARAAKDIEDGAKDRVPVRTGELKDSITKERDQNGRRWVVGTNLWRAHFIEFGTRHHDAQPYLFPAFEEAEARFERRLRQRLLAEIRKAAR